MAVSACYLFAFLVSVMSIIMNVDRFFCYGEPTDGFSEVKLTETSFKKQFPFDSRLEDRYSNVNGVRRLWVYSKDKPHFRGSNTKPRTEIRITGHDYSSGVWQFEGNFYVPKGTTGVCIMQIFGAEGHATTLMLRVYDGALRYYQRQLIEDDIYDRWFRLNVIHDVGGRNVKVFIDGELKLTVSDAGGENHRFKFGVYEQNDSSDYMESRWKGVRVLRKKFT